MNNTVLKWGTAAAMAAGGLLLVDAMFLEKYFFEVKHFTIGNKEGRKKIRLVLLTDLHIKKRLWPYYKRLAHAVNKLQPDIILFAGDMLDGDSRIAPVDTFLGLLRHNIPKVAILGNHDHKDAIEQSTLEATYRKHNCRLLVNETEELVLQGERIVVTGLDDFIEGESCVEEALRDVDREEYHFLLIHSPLQQESVLHHLAEMNKSRGEANAINIGYIFAGHNHGGQVRFFNLVPKLPIMSGRYVNGWYNAKKPFLYLSKGFGTSTLPFRFGSRSELSVFDYGV